MHLFSFQDTQSSRSFCERKQLGFDRFADTLDLEINLGSPSRYIYLSVYFDAFRGEMSSSKDYSTYILRA